MAIKTLKTRIIQKHDTDVNWGKAINFIPEKGEIIIYETSHRVKIGDGITKVVSLPFEKTSWNDITDKPSTYAPSSHNHDDRYYTENEINSKLSEKANNTHTHSSADINSLDASKLTGTISIDRLPQGALERLITVANQAARFKLTSSNVQLGDTVQQLDTKRMYIVTDISKLSSEAGYTEYTAGSASSVPWSGVSGKPNTFTPSSHTHSKNEVGLGNVDNTADANKSVKYATNAGNADTIDGYHIEYANGYTTSNPTYICGFDTNSNKIKCASNGYISGTLTVTGNITTNGASVIKEGDNRLSNARPASDVSAWAKKSTKPTYTADEIKFSDGETFQKKFNDGELTGPQGPAGEKGDTGAAGKNGATGSQGPRGYDFNYNWSGTSLGVKSSNEGSYQYVNLKGEPGKNGSDGKQGPAGANGKSVTHSWSGSNLTLTSASGTTTTDLRGPQGNPGTNGKNGQDGYTPQKGTDYFTSSEISAITNNAANSAATKVKLTGSLSGNILQLTITV